MIAIDTNVVIRYLTGDHPTQSAAAQTLVDGNEVFFSRTVVLECEWVLRSVYGYSAEQVCDGLRSFAGLPTVVTENPALVAQALEFSESGLDFADALHLAATMDCESFATFDRDFAARAKKLGIDKVSAVATVT